VSGLVVHLVDDCAFCSGFFRSFMSFVCMWWFGTFLFFSCLGQLVATGIFFYWFCVCGFMWWRVVNVGLFFCFC